MALLSIEQRKHYFSELDLGEYNADNILKVQKKYLLRKTDWDGVYGTNTDNLVRHLKAVKDNCQNFAPEEFRCGCNGRYCSGYPTYMKPIELANIQSIRTHYGKPMTVTCGVRCTRYNSIVGGIKNSEHLKGLAVDYYIAGVTDTLANRKKSVKWIKTLPNHHYTYGNGIYVETVNGKTYTGSKSASGMGNALHTDSRESASNGTTTNGKLIVDGVGGAATVKAMQKFFGTVQDGVISGQNKACAKYYPSLKAVDYGKGGSDCVRKLQKWVGANEDGILGQITVKLWQKKLGVTQDGIFGTNSMKAWQKFLNKYQKVTDVPNIEPEKEKDAYSFIDVSDWQSKIDWAKVKAAGIDGAIIRYADGTTLDKRFAENMSGAINAGLHVGAYIFSRAKTKAEAEKEAERLFNACKPYKYDMPLYIDLEVSTLAKYADTVAAAFLNKMASLGARGGVYANLNWWNNYLTKTAKNYSASAFWIAQYNDTMDYKPAERMGMWQYTSSGTVNGISGKVDRDKCYVAYWKKETDPGGKGPEPEKPKVYTGEYPSTKLEKTPQQVTDDALLFSKWIVNDNRFGYGRQGGSKYKDCKAYHITHSGGCHFCGSNAHKIAEAKKAGLKDPEQWEYTYVCNTFVHACYAHSGVPSMLKAKGHAWWIGSYQKSKYWTEIKKPSKITDLKPGDLLAWGSNGGTSGHFCMYVGNGKGREATSNGLGATFTQAKWNSSIRETDFSRHFKAATHVFRFTGSINTTANIRYGEVSDRVKLLQEFLIWYGFDISADKCFGDATLKAVKKFQKEQDITVDGIVGSATIAKMKSVRK